MSTACAGRQRCDTVVVNPLLTPGLRATYLSLQSLAGRLAFACYLLAMSLLLAGDGSVVDMQRMLLAACVLGLVALPLLLLLAPAALLEDGRCSEAPVALAPGAG